MISSLCTCSWFCILILLSVVFSGCGDGNNTHGDQGEQSNLVSIENYEPAQLSAMVIDEAPAALDNFIEDYNSFAITYFAYHTDKFNSFEDEFVFSPLSYANIFSVFTLGAAGETREEFQDFISRSASLDDQRTSILPFLFQEILSGNTSNEELTISNKLWGHTGYRFHIDYLENLATYFQVEREPFDFMNDAESFQENICNWIDDYLNLSMDSDSLVSVSTRTRAVLANAFALSGRWEIPFNSEDNFEGLFEDTEGVRRKVPMIHTSGTFNAYQDDEVFAYELPLSSPSLSMVVFMPAGTKWHDVYGTEEFFSDEDLGESFESEAGPCELYATFPDNSGDVTYVYNCQVIVYGYLEETNYYDFLNNFDSHYQTLLDLLTPRQVEINLPEFHINTTIARLSTATGNGVLTAFNEDEADFSPVNGRGYLFASDFMLNATIDLNGDGLNSSGEGHAVLEATQDEPDDVWRPDDGLAVWIIPGTPEYEYTHAPPQSHARPFIWVIRDKTTEAILYIGHLTYLDGEIAR